MRQRKVRSYDKEFKLNAVNLYLASGKSYEQISHELGIPTATLVGWVLYHKKDGPSAFPGKGHIKPTDLEVMELRKELAVVREERDILKKALGIFSSRGK
jgi:transposase-like protein